MVGVSGAQRVCCTLYACACMHTLALLSALARSAKDLLRAGARRAKPKVTPAAKPKLAGKKSKLLAAVAVAAAGPSGSKGAATTPKADKPECEGCTCMCCAAHVEDCMCV